jgi:lysophospholipase L1-like esterase
MPTPLRAGRALALSSSLALALAVISAPRVRAETPATAFQFQFGAAQAAPGYTLVAPSQRYSKAIGYGFEAGPTLRTVTADAAADPLQRGAVTAAAPFAFSVAVPEGNYRVTVTLGDPQAAATATVKTQTRRLMVEHLRTEAGQFATRTFTVNIRGPKISTGGEVNLDSHERNPATGEILVRHWDEKLTITLSDTHPALAAVTVAKVDDAITVFVLGDSTVTDQPGAPGSSWGQMFPRWFRPEVAIANHAESGETLKGFLKERRWDKVLDSIKPGDYVLIEFGTNDSKKSGPQNIYPNQDFSETYAEASTTYKELLRRFVADARARGANPVLISPSSRRGEVKNPSSLGRYAAAAGEVAREVGVPFIDLNAMGHQLNAALGPDAVKQFNDVTHHVEYGSYMQSKCVVLGIQQAHLPLAKFIVEDFGDFDPTHPEPTPAHFLVPPDPRRTGGRRGARAGSPPVPAALPLAVPTASGPP